jgi:2,3-dihydroxybiphenyl 1,2-dioxygenase
MTVLNLAYLGLGVADLCAWRRQATSMYGMEEAGPTADGELRFRLDDKLWRVALRASQSNDISYVGFEVSDAETALRLSRELGSADIGAKLLTPAEAEARGVAGGIRVKDPDGLDVELVHGLASARSAFKSPAGVTFVTGAMGLGHVVLSTAHIDRSLEFYRRLGFSVSDYINVKLAPDLDANVVFMHCNPRHHTVALLPVSAPKRLNHLMLQVNSVDDVLGAYYRAIKEKIPIARHMGRHINDHMLSFYATTPSGFDIEFGCGAREIGRDWSVEQYDRISLWGHENV